MKAVNLLPSDLRGAPKASAARPADADASRGPGAFVVLGALAFGVVALAGYVLTGNTIKERQGELNQLQARAQVAAQRAGVLKPYAEFDQLSKARVATVRDLAGRRFDWEHTLRDLSRAVPADVTLTQLSGSISSTSGGEGDSQLRGAIAAPAITLQGCTRTQSSVARLMGRLRDIDGVTRVSLSHSNKPEENETAAAGTTDSSDEKPCGEGGRPDFEVVAFFENATAASADPSASSASPATGGATTPGTAATPGQQASTSSATQPGTATTASATTPATTTPATTTTTGGTK